VLRKVLGSDRDVIRIAAVPFRSSGHGSVCREYSKEARIIQYARGFVAVRRGRWLVSTNGLTKDQATVVISARVAQA
jgi:hypothetical protein